jgi:hypothetical protein
VIIGIGGAFLGVFFRNCLKPRNMIFNFWYDILRKWVWLSREDIITTWEMERKVRKPTIFQKFKGKIAYILGYCIYCTATWITIFMHIYFLGFNEYLIFSGSIQHIVIVLFCKYVLSGFEELEYKR